MVRPCINVEIMTSHALFVSSLGSISDARTRESGDRGDAPCRVSLLLCLWIGYKSLGSKNGGEMVHLIIFSSLISLKGSLCHVVPWPCSSGMACFWQEYLPLNSTFLTVASTLLLALLPSRITAVLLKFQIPLCLRPAQLQGPHL